MHRTRQLLAFSLIGLAAAALIPRPVEACGGTFCAAGPTVMPVDQTGESILFWVDDNGGDPYTEAHIQIQYQGDAESFAWIVPVQEVPEVLVGSQALFDNLLQATVPTFTTGSSTTGDCSGGGGGGWIGCGDDAAFFDGAVNGSFTGFGGESGGDGGDGGPEILDRGLAGAFEYVTLTGDNIDEIVDWLDQNGYAQDEDAPPILDEYLQEGFVFVAIKLRSGVGVDEIHPLAIRYSGTEPCIPIRLTRIAAVDDMAIRAFFLGDSRYAPQNWPHVVVNHSRWDWVNGPATNYQAIASLAIDEAGGRAFITEYAGTDAVVSTGSLSSASWNAAAFETVEPVEVVDELVNQGLIDCLGAQCSFGHPQVRGLLEKYLPAPDAVDADEFWGCLSCFPDLIDPVAWGQQPGFAADFESRISGPGAHAVEMLADASYLTRLYTLLSPHEMIEDPLFHGTSGLPTIDNNISGTRVTDCGDGPTYYDISDGRSVAVDVGGAWPNIEGLPAAERVEQIPMTGPPQVELDNGPLIDQLIDEYNATRLTGPEPSCAVRRVHPEGVLALFAVFGIAWINRRKRS